ncbi:uncharacterized protein [Clytia hemisphaerica]|uniref:uncharacterized protein isoform X2 n=1 Tax=Clytia hemisphaerica TaxID=252671 RepID=UPI0034D734D4
MDATELFESETAEESKVTDFLDQYEEKVQQKVLDKKNVKDKLKELEEVLEENANLEAAENTIEKDITVPCDFGDHRFHLKVDARTKQFEISKPKQI